MARHCTRTTADSVHHFDHYDDDFNAEAWFPSVAARLQIFQLVRNLGWAGESRRERRAAEVTDAAISWLQRHHRSPLFLWIHYYDPHTPYEPPAEYESLHAPQAPRNFKKDWTTWSNSEKERLIGDRTLRDHMNALYDAEISYTDAEIGRLLAALHDLGKSDNLLTVVTSDHGESLGEHDSYYTHRDLYEVNLLVPLIFHHPTTIAPALVSQEVRLTDVAASVLEVLQLDLAELPGDGRSLEPAWADGQTLSPEPSSASLIELNWHKFSATLGRYKLIFNSPRWSFSDRIPAHEELFDLIADPQELDNLLEQLPGKASEMRELLDRYRDVPQDLDIDPATLRQLQSLGYFQ